MGESAVFVIRSRKGYESLISVLGDMPSVLWVAEGLFDPQEVDDLKHHGVDVRVFPLTGGALGPVFGDEVKHIAASHSSNLSIFFEYQSTD
jgi:hypothetical protein